MRKFVSPRAARKVLDTVNKTFGVPLEELLRQMPADGCTVPAAVKRICEYIYKHGIDQEGIFRVSGSARVVDKLKTSFNMNGDADLEGEGDIMAVGGLLKLFLRELPDSLIPEHLTQEFIAIETGKTSEQDYMLRLRSRLHSLPDDNFALLKYVICFLVAVSHHQNVNKMSPMALSIVFGPNIFRCGDGIAGLKDQGTINLIVAKLISKYDELFKDEDEPAPIETWAAKMKKTPPPRPPPPKIVSPPVDTPVPLPRKLSSFDVSNQLCDGDVGEIDHDAVVNHSSNAQQPSHLSDDESHGRASPFILESESQSIIESPMVTARISELVEKTICDTITERLFGIDLGSARISPMSRISSDASSNEQRLDELASSVRAKVEMFERRNSQPDEVKSLLSTDSLQRKDGGASKIMMTELNGLKNAAGEFDRRYSPVGSFDEVQRDSDLLENMKRPIGPARRSPSASFRQNSSEKKEVDSELTELLEETAIVISGGKFQTQTWKNGAILQASDLDSQDRVDGKEDINHNHHKKIHLGFLNIHEDQENDPYGVGSLPSPEQSPLSKHKPFIPPLDLSILHEHVDGSVPILASNTQSSLWDKKLRFPSEDSNGVPSPRATKFKKRTGAASNTDIPPSPPKHQEQYLIHSLDDDYSLRLKQMTKKIQVLKRKIKCFEEEFEQEHGYKPSQGEKAAKADIKKYMTELSFTRKSIKKLREECEQGNRSRHGSGASSSGEAVDRPHIEDTLNSILVSLKDKRQEACRPEDLTLMTREQVQEEKLSVQKALLYFEGLHGRPSRKEDKDLMRPLYDRYRAIKRMLAKPISPRASLELPTVPEDQMMEIPVGSTGAGYKHPIHIPTAEDEGDRFGTTEFAVTQDYSIFNTVFLGPSNRRGSTMQKVRKKDTSGTEMTLLESTESNLHELGMPELHEELERSKGEKKELRHQLREFEKSFLEKHGRKVQKEDRNPMQESYLRYKQVKARLRLLEALVLKHRE